jgi:hypothetical protein
MRELWGEGRRRKLRHWALNILNELKNEMLRDRKKDALWSGRTKHSYTWPSEGSRSSWRRRRRERGEKIG